jgi:hypothetical protein
MLYNSAVRMAVRPPTRSPCHNVSSIHAQTQKKNLRAYTLGVLKALNQRVRGEG